MGLPAKNWMPHVNTDFSPFQFFDFIFKYSPDPILITDNNVKIMYVNSAWEKLTGYTQNDILGKSPRFLKSGKTSKLIYNKLRKALEKRIPFITDKFVNKKKNGNTYQIRSSFYPIQMTSNTYYFVQVSYDITSEKYYFERQKELLYESAHELKTPITVLKLLIHSHINKAKTKEEDIVKLSELQLIDHELERIMKIVNDMLDNARLETGKLFIDYQKVNLVTLILETMKKTQIYAKNHKLLFKGTHDEVLVFADPKRIDQVLVNLLSNAIRYSHSGTSVEIVLKKRKTCVLVSVKDEGYGIPKSDQKYVFDRYYQVKAKNKTGCGLGLYISKEIIKLHKGKIWVESEIDKGSTFMFTLPRIGFHTKSRSR